MVRDIKLEDLDQQALNSLLRAMDDMETRLKSMVMACSRLIAEDAKVSANVGDVSTSYAVATSMAAKTAHYIMYAHETPEGEE